MLFRFARLREKETKKKRRAPQYPWVQNSITKNSLISGELVPLLQNLL
jgi:hypothetical protein